MKVRWTRAARNDLREVRSYIARDSRLYASRVIDAIKAATDQLGSFPALGSKVEDWDREDLRELLEGNYRIIYPHAPQRGSHPGGHPCRPIPP